MSADIDFEYNVPVFAGPPDSGTEPVHRDTPCYEALDWETTRMGIETAEELGFDAVWAPDHLMLGRDHAEYECWTLLSAIAGFTDDVNIGSLVLANDYRNPALVAKMAATLDVFEGDPETLAHKIGVTEDHCETVGRDPDEIEYSWDGHVICTRDEEKRERLLDLMTPIQFEEELVDQPDITRENAGEYFVVGTPEECAEAIKHRIDVGITKFQGWFVDFPDTSGMNCSPTR
jgi:alkanesulfonate monooxygenase SsuD/methylene tetrahydromethanopterin reductase-like flavin-dependent oxidoreductase (luciferase family)